MMEDPAGFAEGDDLSSARDIFLKGVMRNVRMVIKANWAAFDVVRCPTEASREDSRRELERCPARITRKLIMKI